MAHPDPSDAIDYALRHNIPLPEVTEAGVATARARGRVAAGAGSRTQLEAHVRHLESALKTAGRVLQPYLSGTRR
jgi:hypothetical protein